MKHPFLVLLLLWLAVIVVAFRDMLFLQNLALYKDVGSDSLNIFYPVLFQLAECFRSEGFSGWSFHQGMGQGIFPVFFADIFLLPLVMIGSCAIAYGMAIVQITKMLVATVLFYLYLRRIGLGSVTSIVGALLFGFSGYIVFGITWIYMSTEAAYAALLLLLMEDLLQRGRWVLLPVPFLLFTLMNPVWTYLYALFLVPYGILRFVELHGVDLRRFGRTALKLSGSALLGILAGAFSLFPCLHLLVASPRGSTQASYVSELSALSVFAFQDAQQLLTTAFRAFSNDILGTSWSFSGWGNYLEAPILYSGLVTLLLVPQAFVILPVKRRLIYGALLLVAAVPMLFPFFRHAFWLFTGNYYRTLPFMATLLLLYIGLRALSHIIKESTLNVGVLGATLMALIVVLYFPYGESLVNIDHSVRDLVAVLLVVDACVLFLVTRAQTSRLMPMLLLALVCFEAVAFTGISLNRREVVTVREWKSKTGYHDRTVDAVAWLRQIDSSFYRLNKDYASSTWRHSSMNDAMVQGYYGTSSYQSFNQGSYVRFLAFVDIIDLSNETQTRWVAGLADRPLLQTLVSSKYWLTRRSDLSIGAYGYRGIGVFGDVGVYRNDQYLPLGFCYDTVFAAGRFGHLSPLQKDAVLLRAIIPQNGDTVLTQCFPALPESSIAASDSLTYGQYVRFVEIRRRDTLAISSFRQSRIEGTVDCRKRELLFLSIPFDRGWGATVDGKKVRIWQVNGGLMGILLEQGHYRVILQYQPPFMVQGLMVSLVTLLLYGFLVFWFYRVRSRP